VRGVFHTSGCERARAWAALQPDGELSELERRLLAVHVARCTACASFAAGVEALVEEVRAAPLEPVPAGARAVAWRHRTIVPATRAAGRIASVAAAAAAGIIAFSLGAETFGDVERSPAPAPILIEITGTDVSLELDAFRDARRADLLATMPEPVQAGQHTGANPL
jgi:hypothetical protein